jgi:hypothetical protein
VTSSTEGGAASLTAKRLDPLGLAMLAIADESMNVSISDGIVNLMETAELIERKSTQKWDSRPLPSLNVPCFNMQMGGQW